MATHPGRWSRLRAAASYDVFPEFSAHVRRLLYNPLGLLALCAVAALVCGLFLHPRGLVLCGGIAVVILLGVLWPWLSLRGLGGGLAFDRPRVGEGETVAVELTLRNRLPWAVPGLTVHFEASDTPLATAPARRVSVCAWSFTPTVRGVYPRQPPRLRTGFPFGLWENARALTASAALIVWPRTFPVGPVPLPSGEQQLDGQVARHKVGSGGDVLGVRPYRRGDSPRRIHWPQSARHDRLIVCELQSNARPVVQLVLDADPEVHAGRGDDSSREWAIRIVASLARGWIDAGAQVAAVWGGRSYPAASGPAQLRRLLDSLAALPDDAGPLAATLDAPECRTFRDGVRVVVTTDRCRARANPHEDERWIVLCTDPAAPTAPRQRPWLWIDAPRRVPEALRNGWREARHGS